MLSEETTEKLVERLTSRIEEGNTYILKTIAENISKFGTLNESKARQLAQILKYGGSYEKIANKLSSILNVNVQEIYKIFEEVAKIDYEFAGKFYKYRNKDYIPYTYNTALQNQVKAIARQTAEQYINLSNTSAIGFTIKDINGNTIFKGLKEAYYNAIDTASINVGQGKETFDTAIKNIVNNLGGSGIKTIDYASGRTRRLDSAIRMNLKQSLRDLHNNLQQQFGNEFGADGVEISVHLNPADDHQDIQGKQFSNEEFEKLQNNQIATDYEGKIYQPNIVTKTGRLQDRRAISELNCYHYIFSIVLGVNKPEYTNKQLQDIIDNNNKGFEFEGKHYTNYEGTQLQRQLETEIRKQKDIQIMANKTNNEELMLKSQSKINILTTKYNELSNVSELKKKTDRLRVTGYTLKGRKNYKKPLNNIYEIAEYINYKKNDFDNLDIKELQLKLNEKNNFNDKPKLLNQFEFDNLKEMDNYWEPDKNKNNQYAKVYRGWDNKYYYDKYINGKNSYGNSGFVDGVGTYATDNEWVAEQYTKDDKLIMEIAIPNNAKFISKTELNNLHYNIYKNFNNNREYFEKKYNKKVIDILDIMNENISSTAVLNNYEFIYNNEYRNWVILNRKKVIIKQK